MCLKLVMPLRERGFGLTQLTSQASGVYINILRRGSPSLLLKLSADDSLYLYATDSVCTRLLCHLSCFRFSFSTTHLLARNLFTIIFISYMYFISYTCIINVIDKCHILFYNQIYCYLINLLSLNTCNFLLLRKRITK